MGSCEAASTKAAVDPGSSLPGKHVNYVGALSASSSEAEFLFPPYSVFCVLRLERSPHHLIVELQAAVDNRLEPEDLPLAPWS